MYSNTKILVLALTFFAINANAQKPEKSKTLVSQIQDIDPSTSRYGDISLLQSQLLFGEETSMKKISSSNDHLGFRHDKYQQYFKGVRVEGATYTIHKHRGKSVRLSGQFLNIQDLDIQPAISAQEAQRIARSNFPSGKLADFHDANNTSDLVIYYHIGSQNYHLAYKVDVYNQEPLFRADIYVDARNGKIVDHIEKIHTTDIEAQGHAIYNGQVNIIAQNMESNFRLRNEQNKSETYNLSNGTDYNTASDISSADLMFDEDPVAVQAHWGAEQTYQYFMQSHSRNSFDGNGTKIKSYVHYSTDYANAFWDGLRMTYGDGNGTTISPLVSLDVVAHEITHGVTQNSAGLIYKYEAGALNESFSDIFAESVEYFVKGNNDWLIGKEIYTNGQAIRSMSNPNIYSDPDTYLGDHWYMGAGDNGGVHTNSGVQNKWFHLLSTGGGGTNDHGESYNVAPIGIEKSAEIAYRNLTVYLNTYSNLYNARQGAIQAAKDLYGNSSQEVVSVTNAWHAVGVGSKFGDPECREGAFHISLTVDNYPEETSWELVDASSSIIASGGLYTSIADGSTINETIQLDPGNYTFVINDTYGDGICCGYGSGQYELKVGGTVIRRGSYFASSDPTEFCIDGIVPEQDLTPPSQPTGLDVFNISQTSADVSWNPATDNNSVSGYNVFLDDQQVAFTAATNYSFDGLSSDKEYLVGVESVDDSNNTSSRSSKVFSTLPPIDNPPSEPDNVFIDNITYSSASLSWSASSDDGISITYHVYLNNGFYGSTTSLSMELSPLMDLTTYEVYVQAEDDSSQLSSYTTRSFTTLEAPDKTPPTVPGNITVSEITTTSAVVSWNESTDESGILYYEVYLDNNLHATTESPFISITGLQENTTYNVQVRALDNNGNFSDFSGTDFTTLEAPDTTPPSMPQNLTITEITTGSALVSWNESTDESGILYYEVYLDNNLHATTESLFISITGLQENTTYNVQVRALDYNGNFSDLSGTDFTTAEAPDTTPPSMPENLIAFNITASGADISWDESTDESGIKHYVVYVNDVFHVSQQGTSLQLNGLNPSSEYSVRVAAEDNIGYFSIFNSLSFTTLEETDDTPPSDPQNLSFQNITYHSAVATWQESSDESGISHYEIYLDGSYIGNSAVNIFSINGLNELTSYVLGVKAVDINNIKSNLTSGEFTTLQQPDYEPPTSPEGLVVHSITVNSAVVEWNLSLDNVAVTGYNVYLNNERLTFVTDNIYSLSGLTQGTTYEVAITAFDAEDNESEATITTFTTLEITTGPSEELIMGSSFETGWEGWIDGGADCYRYRGRNAIEGRYSIRLRDNSRESSSMTTSYLDLSTYNKVLFKFSFMPSSMEYREDFFVEFYDGFDWIKVASYASGTDFQNDNIYTSELILDQIDYRFDDYSRFRIRCDASSNADRVYIDEVSIIGNPSTTNSGIAGEPKTYVNGNTSIFPEVTEVPELTLSPNPTVDFFKIEYDGEITKVQLFSLDGKVLRNFASGGEPIHIGDFSEGIYLVRIYTEEGRIFQKKIVKTK